MARKATPISRSSGLSAAMSLRAFEHGYWYAVELRAFAVRMGIASAGRLRKDQLEAAIKALLFTKGANVPVISGTPKQGLRDVDRGLRLGLPVVHYTSNKETKSFIEREAAKIRPGFKRASRTRYLLNRWREKQIAARRRITYRDLLLQAIALNQSKCGPLRVEQGRYINFTSDYMANNKGASHEAAVRAWHEVKTMDTPKTYAAWVRFARS